MVRKRIADLLNEEGEKLNTENGAAAPDATSDDTNLEETTVVKSTRTTSARRNPTRTTRQNQNNPEVEGVVGELQATLEQVQKSEKLLQQQVIDLQKALDEQRSLVEKFKQELETTESLKAELDQAKKTIVQLAEANSNLIEERTPVQIEKPTPVQKEPEYIQPVKSRPHYKSARQTVVFPDQEQDGKTDEGEYKDFAKNSWLL